MGSETFSLPAGFPGCGTCRVKPTSSGRSFGSFLEKTLDCDGPAREAIDQLCWQGGFTQAWAEETTDGLFTMTKIPAIILVKLMLGLGPEQEEVVESLVGAYAICMAPDVRTCMNVIVGRRPNPQGGYVLDKFSLYYPDNAAIQGDNWDLLQGYSFRTAALSGSLNRAGLDGLRRGLVPVAAGSEFDAATHGLVIDDASAYEDCAYVETREGETNEEREQRIDGMVEGMKAAYGTQGILSMSFDPAESQLGVTALESEWRLLQRELAKERAAAPPAAAPEPEAAAPSVAVPDPEEAAGGAECADVTGDVQAVQDVEKAVQGHMMQHQADLEANGVAAAGALLQAHVQAHMQAHMQAFEGTLIPAEEGEPPEA